VIDAGATENEHRERGDTVRAAGNLSAASDVYAQGVDLAPDEVALHLRLGNAFVAQARPADAITRYRRAVALDPAHREARIRLADALRRDAQYDAAAAILQTLAAEFPLDPVVHKERGRLAFAQQELTEAHVHFTAAAVCKPDDPDVHHWLANIANLRGDAQAARDHYARSLMLKPFLRVPAATSPASFSALLLFAPGGANTPPDTLVKGAPYDSLFVLLVPEIDYDIERLRGAGDVVVNLVSDVDHARAVMPTLQTLVERIGLPVVNHPRAIAQTDRVTVATRLAHLPACRVPGVEWSTPAQLTRELGLEERRFPFLLRVPGTHGGEQFEKLATPAEVITFVAQHPAQRLYVTEYVDYRSADGFFRKYRFFFVGDQILPYHLAIGATWKVHHARTDMAQHPWMQHEEKDFLDDPAGAFGPHHFAALDAIRVTIGLDFFGIDCALDRDGKLVIFEVNASMLVHENHGPFTYKAPAVARIKSAFDAMLAARAAAG
jgi:Flp pilus assembly protein TadD/glutathione synthase/RimK-type ligase-like ATP-grasp enzyme